MQARTAFLLATAMTALAAAPLAKAAILTTTPARTLTDAVLDSGEASWYGPRHVGVRTSSGERFDPRRMTAAHASLPLGTIVRVTDAATGRSIIVRVNDREPPHGVRCIDLSEGAAYALGIHGRGVANVTLTAVDGGQGPVEVAEAPDDDMPAATAPRGRPHRHRAGR